MTSYAKVQYFYMVPFHSEKLGYHKMAFNSPMAAIKFINEHKVYYNKVTEYTKDKCVPIFWEMHSMDDMGAYQLVRPPTKYDVPLPPVVDPHSFGNVTDFSD